MFDLDKWQEIFQTISKNKLRTFLTAFSVSWGIFMLILLLGFGEGLKNGAASNFKGDAVNSLWFDAGETSIATKGLGKGRRIKWTNADRDLISSTVHEIEKASSRNHVWQATIKYGDQSTSFDIMWVHPNYRYMEELTVTKGRFLNESDYRNNSKVVALGTIAEGLLFKPGEDPLGKYIIANGVPFKVVGVFDDPGGDRDMRRLYMPMTTGQKVFNGKTDVENISMLTGAISTAKSKELEERLVKLLAERHNVDPADHQAIRVWNNVEQFQQIMQLFTVINAIIWWIGLMTLFAGIIGVANVMTITVKERTREIGIRKAMGATPASILGMILQEAVFITVLAGFGGMVAGILMLDSGLLLDAMQAIGIETDFLINPAVGFGIAISATLVLIIAGTIAGIIPAVRAAKINPITAIRE